MNEFELQTLIMQAREVKPADKFVMLCILKNVDWSTWKGTVTLSYISKKYDVNRRTLTRNIQRLKDLGWIRVITKDDETRITVNIKDIADKKTLDKMSSTPIDKMSSTHRQNDYTPIDKMSSTSRQNVYPTLDKMSTTPRQNVYHNNIINNNNINNNINNNQNLDQQANSYAEYRELYLQLYNVDIDHARSYIREEKWSFLERNKAFPRWVHLSSLGAEEKEREILARFNYTGLPITKANLFKDTEWRRECRK